MPKIRHDAARAVAAKYTPAKLQATLAAASAYECLATMLVARDEVRMGPDYANDILLAVRDAADTAFDLQAKMHEVHTMLAPIRAAFGIEPGAFGPNETANPQKVFTTAQLRSVA